MIDFIIITPNYSLQQPDEHQAFKYNMPEHLQWDKLQCEWAMGGSLTDTRSTGHFLTWQNKKTKQRWELVPIFKVDLKGKKMHFAPFKNIYSLIIFRQFIVKVILHMGFPLIPPDGPHKKLNNWIEALGKTQQEQS